MKKRFIAKIVLSLFVVFHILAVLLMPNPDSFFTREFGFIFQPYATTLGLNTPWQFFSPDPSSHVYFEYELYPADPNKEEYVHRWPPATKDGYLADNYMRLIYHSRFTTSSPDRIQTFLIPWLCRLHPNTEEITLRTLSEELISLNKARIVGGPISNLFEIKFWGQITQECPTEENTP